MHGDNHYDVGVRCAQVVVWEGWECGVEERHRLRAARRGPSTLAPSFRCSVHDPPFQISFSCLEQLSRTEYRLAPFDIA